MTLLKLLLPLLIVINQPKTDSTKISGYIFDHQTQEEVIGVKIISDCDTVYSNLDGSFEIKYNADTSDIFFYHPHYETDIMEVMRGENTLHIKIN